MLSSKFKVQSSKLIKGFTMIELLIVIAVLGVLAVAVLSAINPIEQINRGKDTGTRSDAEQLLSAVDRFYTNQAYYPWQSGTADVTGFAEMTIITAVAPIKTGFAPCTMLNVLSNGIVGNANCEGSEELKLSFVNRVTAEDAAGNPRSNRLNIYYDNALPGNSVYICFQPKSGSFRTEATKRCTDGLPDDLPEAVVCNVTFPDGTLGSYSCLP